MDFLITALNRAFDLLFFPFKQVRPDLAILVISVVTGVAMLYLYVWTSDQARLKAVQSVVKARIIEIQLYRTDLFVMMRALFRVFMKNFTYLRLLLLPAAFLLLLVVIIVVQCYPRFENRPVRPGEDVIITASFRDAPAASLKEVRLDVPDGVTVETTPLTVPSLGEVNWRVSAKEPGVYDISVTLGGETVGRTLVAGAGLTGVSPSRVPPGFTGYLMNPLELPLPAGSAFSGLTVNYPHRDMGYGILFGMNWIIYFFVVSFVVALAWKFAAGVH